MADREVSVSRVIDAPPQQIFEVLADPAKHAIIDGSGTVRRARGNPERLELGSTFGMDMRIGLPYIIRNTVVEFEEARVIAWRHFGRHIWRYELEPVDDGTRVTESFIWRTALVPRYIELMRYPEKHPPAMERTLERLDTYVTTGEIPER